MKSHKNPIKVLHKNSDADLKAQIFIFQGKSEWLANLDVKFALLKSTVKFLSPQWRE